MKDKSKKARKIRKMAWYNEYKNRPCEMCGKTFPVVCMDLHHRNHLTKRDKVGRLINDDYSLKTIKEEAKKCMCICSNCHRIAHEDDNYASVSRLEKYSTLDEFLGNTA